MLRSRGPGPTHLQNDRLVSWVTFCIAGRNYGCVSSPDMRSAMRTVSLYGRTAGPRRVLLQAGLFGAVTTVGFIGMLTIDWAERMSTIAYTTCGGECSNGPGQADLSAVSSGSSRRPQQRWAFSANPSTSAHFPRWSTRRRHGGDPARIARN